GAVVGVVREQGRAVRPEREEAVAERDAGRRCVEEPRRSDVRRRQLDGPAGVAAVDLERYGLAVTDDDVGAGVAHEEPRLGRDVDVGPEAAVGVVAPEPVAVEYSLAAEVVEQAVRELDVVAALEGRGAWAVRRGRARPDSA